MVLQVIVHLSKDTLDAINANKEKALQRKAQKAAESVRTH
jgi:hypothetical protein